MYEQGISNGVLASVLHDVRLSYSNVRFNGSLLKSNEFRLDAGPEVDAAWKSLGADCEPELSPLNIEHDLTQTGRSCSKYSS